MSDGDDTLGSLPPTRVKWKEQMEDIKEATLEGSQFEAQFADDRASVKLVSEPPRPPTPRFSRPESEVRQNDDVPKTRPSSEVVNSQTNRPKTTLRRTTSEKQTIDQETKSPAVSRKSTQELLSTSRSRQQGSAPARKQSFDNQKHFTQAPSKKVGRTEHMNGVNSSSDKSGEKRDGSQSQSSLRRNGVVSDRSEPSSRVNSSLSFNQRSDSTGRSTLKSQKSEIGGRTSMKSRPFTSAEVVQAKGRIMDHGW